MNKPFSIKPVLAAVLLAASCAAQAAHLDYVSHLGFGGYSGATGSEFFSADLVDLSTGGEVALIGAQPSYVTPTAGGVYSHGYAADAYYGNGSVQMSFTHFLGADISGPTINHQQQNVLSSLAEVKLKVAGDGEAMGSPVQVSFAGFAHAINFFTPGMTSYMQMDIAVFNDGVEVGSFLWDASGLNEQRNFGFSFNAEVGDELSFSATLAGGAFADGISLAGLNGQIDLLASSAMFGGEFSVTAVSEPEQYALFLAGLGVLGAIARRRRFA